MRFCVRLCVHVIIFSCGHIRFRVFTVFFGTCLQIPTPLNPLHEMHSNFPRNVSIPNTTNCLKRFWISFLVAPIFDFDFDDFLHRNTE